MNDYAKIMVTTIIMAKESVPCKAMPALVGDLVAPSSVGEAVGWAEVCVVGAAEFVGALVVGASVLTGAAVAGAPVVGASVPA